MIRTLKEGPVLDAHHPQFATFIQRLSKACSPRSGMKLIQTERGAQLRVAKGDAYLLDDNARTKYQGRLPDTQVVYTFPVELGIKQDDEEDEEVELTGVFKRVTFSPLPHLQAGQRIFHEKGEIVLRNSGLILFDLFSKNI